MNSTIIGDELPTIPWEEKPADCIDMVWRFGRNTVFLKKKFLRL
jgi:beta-1,4-mannooligosaccharide/beta-1,4-mannosyl-N-acetylglucosamine phosphorylase